MQVKFNAEAIIILLKSCIRWKNNSSIKANKLALNIFLDFVKLRLLPNNEKSTMAFLNFIKKPDDLKFEGKLETWIEIGLDTNPDIIDELAKKAKNVDAFYTNNIIGEEKKEEKIIQDVKAETAEVQKAEVIEIHDDEDDDLSQSALRPIIVPWDFSTVAQYALEHAVLLAKTTGCQIYILHLTKSDKEISSATIDLKKIVDDTFAKSQIRPEIMVQTGNILKTITQIANDNNAKFVIMGTHGIKGIQKFTGSLALKVIAGTNTPFIVIQEPPATDSIRNVVFPIDHTKENKQKLKQAKLLAYYYKVKYYLTMPDNISNPQIKRNLKTNLTYVKSYFKQHNIEYEVAKVAGVDSFSDATLKFAEKQKPDMIIVLTTKNINIQDYVLGADEQKIIANPSKTPVMCVNPMKVKFASMSVHGVA